MAAANKNTFASDKLGNIVFGIDQHLQVTHKTEDKKEILSIKNGKHSLVFPPLIYPL